MRCTIISIALRSLVPDFVRTGRRKEDTLIISTPFLLYCSVYAVAKRLSSSAYDGSKRKETLSSLFCSLEAGRQEKMRCISLLPHCLHPQ